MIDNKYFVGAGIVLCITLSASVTGCNSSNDPAQNNQVSSIIQAQQPGQAQQPQQGQQPQQQQQQAGIVPARKFTTDALVFAGDGTWATEVTNIEDILTQNGATYQEVNSTQLDGMSVDQITQFGALIFPGGAGGTEAGSLSSQTHANLRDAVQNHGVNYLGFCAGSFVAVAPAPSPGQDVSYGFGIVNGPLLDNYSLENQGTDIAMTKDSFPDGSTKELLWYGGPVTPNTGVIAKYPDGTPAISQMWSGKGFVVLSGPHPTATQETLDALGMSPDTPDTQLAWQLMNAAIHQQPLRTF